MNAVPNFFKSGPVIPIPLSTIENITQIVSALASDASATKVESSNSVGSQFG